MCGSGSVLGIRIRIHKASEYGSNTNQDPQHGFFVFLGVEPSPVLRTLLCQIKSHPPGLYGDKMVAVDVMLLLLLLAWLRDLAGNHAGTEYVSVIQHSKEWKYPSYSIL